MLIEKKLICVVGLFLEITAQDKTLQITLSLFFNGPIVKNGGYMPQHTSFCDIHIWRLWVMLWTHVLYLRAIWQVTSSELSTKQQMRKNLLYTKNTYILKLWRMPSSGMWRHVNLVNWTDVSEELQSSATCSCWFLARRFFYPEDGGDTSSETSVQFIRSTRHHIQEDGILHNHHRENLRSYILKLLLNIATTRIEALVVWGNKYIYVYIYLRQRSLRPVSTAMPCIAKH
jgi:hypothetical protein